MGKTSPRKQTVGTGAVSSLPPEQQAPRYESNRLWGPLGLAVTFILAVMSGIENMAATACLVVFFDDYLGTHS